MTQHGRDRILIAREDIVRMEISRPSAKSTHPAIEGLAEQMIASLGQLESAYLKNRNPVDVWQAIMVIHFARTTLGRRVEFPPWVLAYLFNAADMIGGAVTTPAGDRQRPKSPAKNPDGTTTFFSSWYAGLTAEQRVDVVVEALGFKGRKSWNPLLEAYRRIVGQMAVRRAQHFMEDGLTAKAAAKKAVEESDDKKLKTASDPARRIRQLRRWLSGGS